MNFCPPPPRFSAKYVYIMYNMHGSDELQMQKKTLNNSFS
jgi:hypothetical protein